MAGIISRRGFVLGALGLGLSLPDGIAVADEKDTEDNLEQGSIVDDLGIRTLIPPSVNSILPCRSNAQPFLISLYRSLVPALAYAPSGIEGAYFNSDCPIYGSMLDRNDEDIASIVSAYNPDLIVDVGSYNASSLKKIERLRQQTNVPIVSFEFDPDNFEDICLRLGLIGEIDRAVELIAYIRDVQSRCEVAKRDVSQKRILIDSGDLSTRMKYGQQQVNRFVIEALGHIDVFEQGKSPLLIDPDIFITPNDEAYIRAHDMSSLEGVVWEKTKCVAKEEFYVFPQMIGCLNGVSGLEKYYTYLHYLGNVLGVEGFEENPLNAASEFGALFFG